MIVSIDYDGTWSRDPRGFALLAQSFASRGHEVIVCTGRVTGHKEVERECMPHVSAIVFAHPLTKRQACKKHGYQVDVWIDDKPETVGHFEKHGAVEPRRQTKDRLG